MRIAIAIAMLLLLAAAAALPRPTVEGDGTGASSMVYVRTEDGAQVDLWVEGERVGLTPQRFRMPPGVYFLTAWAPGRAPVLDRLEVRPGQDTGIVIQNPRLDAGRFPNDFARIVAAQARHKDNMHLWGIMAGLTQTHEDYLGVKKMAPGPITTDLLFIYAEGRWQLARGFPDRALQMCDAGLEIEPRASFLWRLRASALMTQGRTERAFEAAAQAVNVDPHNPDNYVLRGEIKRARHDPYGAQLDFLAALELDENHPGAAKGLDAATDQAHAPAPARDDAPTSPPATAPAGQPGP